jgi:hypothetical protein
MFFLLKINVLIEVRHANNCRASVSHFGDESAT